jgi:hypothetical protein
MSSVNLPLLPELLGVIETELIEGGDASGSYWKEVAEQVFAQVGDRQKDFAIGWWMNVRATLMGRQRIEARPTL